MRPQSVRHISLPGLFCCAAVALALAGCNGHLATLQIDGKTVIASNMIGGNQAQETVEQRIAAAKVAGIDIDTSAGNIDVQVSNGDMDTIVVHATKYVAGKPPVEKLKTYLPQVKVTQRLEGGSLIIRSNVARGALPDGVGYWVSYAVIVPTRLAALLRTTSGDIHVKDVEGGVKATTSSGRLDLTGVARRVELQTVSGDISLTDSTDMSAVSVRTSSGTVKLTNISGRFDAHSVSGDVSVEGAQIAAACTAESSSGALKFNQIRAAEKPLALRLTTVSGDIAYHGDASSIEMKTSSGNVEVVTTDSIMPGMVKAESVSGNLSLKIPALISARIDARSVSGNLSLPAGADGTSADNKNDEQHRATVLLGTGVTPVTLRTSSGDIALTTAP